MSRDDPIVSYAVIVDLIGEAAALALSKARGGRSLTIPSPDRLGPSSPVVALVGRTAAEALAARFGGTRIDVPLGPGKRARIWEMRGRGTAIAEIAREMRCTERTVYNVLAGAPPKGMQAPAVEAPPLLTLMGRR